MSCEKCDAERTAREKAEAALAAVDEECARQLEVDKYKARLDALTVSLERMRGALEGGGPNCEAVKRNAFNADEAASLCGLCSSCHERRKAALSAPITVGAALLRAARAVCARAVDNGEWHELLAAYRAELKERGEAQ